MKKFYFFLAYFFSYLALLIAEEPAKSSNQEIENALTLLETAEDALSKLEDINPSCSQSECDGKKASAYLEIAKKLIWQVKENLSACPKFDEPKNCAEILASGHTESGVYTIWLSEPIPEAKKLLSNESSTTKKQLQVYCDMETDNGGWTVIQRRGEFPDQQDFFLDWESYKNGFGNISQEFWLGNENIRLLCLEKCEIRFDLQDHYEHKKFATYKIFYLTGKNYTIHICNYTGDAGDSMGESNHKEFATKDHGDSYTANIYKGGWWYEGHRYANLNGLYLPGRTHSTSVNWRHFTHQTNLDAVEIKVRPK